MSRKFLTALDLTKNELQNAVMQNLAAAPLSPVKGQVYFDSTSNILYWWNGSAWVSAAGGNVGNGTNAAEYTYVGGSGVGGKGHMFATGLLVFGPTGSVFASAFPYIALPAGFDFWGPQYNGPSIGRVSYDDVSAAVLFEGDIIRHGGAPNWMFPRVTATQAAHAFIQGITPTIPFTWVVGDRVNWTINSAVVRTA